MMTDAELTRIAAAFAGGYKATLKSRKNVDSFNTAGDVMASGWVVANVEYEGDEEDIWLAVCQNVCLAWGTEVTQNEVEVVALTACFLSDWFASRHSDTPPTGPEIRELNNLQRIERVTDIPFDAQVELGSTFSSYLWGYVRSNINEIHDEEILVKLRRKGIRPENGTT